MDTVLSPNTSAFLNYLGTFTSDDATKNNLSNPTSLPPSAFFNSMPVPGRDTPEDTPPSAEEASVSPENRGEALSASDDSDNEPGSSKNRRASGTGVNKRKVGQTHRKASVDEEEDEDSDSDMVSGHEDKKAHNDKSESKKKGGRKSGAGEDGKKEPNKAAKRKEQNRAAQKAFRERREAKVKILEEKVAELEAKSYGASVENENLRGILKRLQEENISLKQSAFTFSMPVNGNSHSNSNDSSSTSPFDIPRPQTAKPPTPPLSSVDDGLKSINDVSASLPKNNNRLVDSPESLVSMNSSNGNATDNSQNQQPDLMQSNAFNAFLFGGNNNTNTSSSSNNFARPNANPVQSQASNSSDQLQSFGTQSSSSVATSPTNQSDINALWASLYPQGVEALLGNLSQNNTNSNNGNQQSIGNNGNVNNFTPFTLLNSEPNLMSFASLGDQNQSQSYSQLPQQTSFLQNAQAAQQQQQQQPQQQPQQQAQPVESLGSTNGQFDFNRFAFRDSTNEVSAVTDSMNNWNDITDNSVNDFLASLTGAGNLDSDMNNGGLDQDDAFNTQLQQIFGGNSPSQLFNLGGTSQQTSNISNVGNPFSPTNYLNMSPSPLQSASNSQSPAGQSPHSTASNNDGKSSYSSPRSSGGSSSTSVSAISAPIEAGLRTTTSSLSPSGCLSTFGPPKTTSEIVHVVDPHGNVVKPSDLWLRFGMQHSHVVDHLMIDDLCDQMRSKATCNEGTGRLELAVKDAEQMFRMDAGDDHKARIEKMKSRVTSG
ncbi:uncharacterized protein I206_104182 [Kwoniella pini CBS 10737]|uniref:BZIP domain-containing protein n=1 Tax=Kwoniella pini CBS 10737 TaxID=1296096 RepID=A0A1B9I2F9_9TREE|nr:uncharacterized protein I206_04243 [Kwoniella pini CBS 10737]OCF49719.1 hypothetical protein I206_04243 [Kwoniella pini CBS 10737]